MLQALACGLAPDVRMNPVLLKPTSQIGSQVLVLGRPVGQMRVAQYLEYKPRAWRAVCRAYRELAADRDVLVLEGAAARRKSICAPTISSICVWPAMPGRVWPWWRI